VVSVTFTFSVPTAEAGTTAGEVTEHVWGDLDGFTSSADTVDVHVDFR
jgi:hypothetical protein